MRRFFFPATTVFLSITIAALIAEAGVRFYDIFDGQKGARSSILEKYLKKESVLCGILPE